MAPKNDLRESAFKRCSRVRVDLDSARCVDSNEPPSSLNALKHPIYTNTTPGRRLALRNADWLNHMDAVAQTFIDAGDAAQTAAGLNASEKKEFLSIIGK